MLLASYHTAEFSSKPNQTHIWMSSLTPWRPTLVSVRTCVPTRTYLTFNNDKPWFSTKHKQLCQAKEDTYKSGDKALYKQAKYTLNREIRVAKKNYSGNLKKQLSSNDPTSVWKGLKAITSYKTHPPALRQSTTGWRPERVLLQVWKAKAWSDIPHPLWPSHNTAINTLPSLPLLFLSLYSRSVKMM